ncbi:transcriptional regulator [Paenibacillus montaniterrae]|uniref:Transcriptional regulator n=1 Tax=Paenibacillus montaniterrae TaxID=429341 RepID=A0A919YNS3_9BACL|nr:helix-turn-helix transcriptional regulator [Paenibacillus montaniterrae]GIP16572.1 transcriptional regulator [Paenibacillus montaniterrae]
MNNRIRELRAQVDMTQEQLAELVGVSRQSIIAIENERYNPSLELAYKISKTFHRSIEDVFIFEKEDK